MPAILLKRYRDRSGNLAVTPTGRRILHRVVLRLLAEWRTLPMDSEEREILSMSMATVQSCYSKLHPEWRDKF